MLNQICFENLAWFKKGLQIVVISFSFGKGPPKLKLWTPCFGLHAILNFTIQHNGLAKLRYGTPNQRLFQTQCSSLGEIYY
jgi:hypothetical protein